MGQFDKICCNNVAVQEGASHYLLLFEPNKVMRPQDPVPQDKKKGLGEVGGIDRPSTNPARRSIQLSLSRRICGEWRAAQSKLTETLRSIAKHVSVGIPMLC